MRIETEWVSTAGLCGPELAATWAALRIQIDDSTITRVVDRTDTVRSSIYVPLYPLAESLVTNWWFLLHEVENPAKTDDAAFRRRHALMSIRDGYAFPHLQVLPSGEQVQLIWTSSWQQWSQIEFLDEGRAWVDREEFRECCSALVRRVVQRLVSLGIEGTFLQEEWESIQGADQDEAMFCKTAAGLGLDPYALGEAERTSVINLEDALNQDWFEEAVAVLDPERLDAQVASIATMFRPGESGSLSLDRLRAISPLPASAHAEQQADKPWFAGYALARHVRHELALDGELLATTADLAEALGEEANAVAAVTESRDFGAADLVDGVVTRDDGGLPAFAVRRGRDTARRFQFCRALAEVLESPNSGALVTRAGTDRQQRNRAFAAEFLAPSDVLRTRVRRPTLDEDGVDELAAEFGVSSRLIEHQVRNHEIAQIR